jgi:hypothetical protein
VHPSSSDVEKNVSHSDANFTPDTGVATVSAISGNRYYGLPLLTVKPNLSKEEEMSPCFASSIYLRE